MVVFDGNNSRIYGAQQQGRIVDPKVNEFKDEDLNIGQDNFRDSEINHEGNGVEDPPGVCLEEMNLNPRKISSHNPNEESTYLKDSA